MATEPDLPESLSALAVIASILRDVGAEYVVVGSVAAARWGIPRMTNDVDIVVRMDEHLAESLVAAAEPHFYVDAEAALHDDR